MPGVFVLDSEAVSSLASPGERSVAFARAQAILASAAKKGARVFIPAAVLVEVYRGTRRDAAIDRVLQRDRRVVPLDHGIARVAGGLLGRDGLDSCHTVDASVVATAIRLGGAIVFTGDPDDMRSLARDHPNVIVRSLN
jgi:predicted nucleic acid-binding protein